MLYVHRMSKFDDQLDLGFFLQKAESLTVASSLLRLFYIQSNQTNRGGVFRKCTERKRPL